MTIQFGKLFLEKLRLPFYPIKGFWIQFGRTLKSIEDKSVFEMWRSSASDYYPTNTFIKINKTSTKIKVSFNITEGSNEFKNYTHIYLTALDSLSIPGIEYLKGIKVTDNFNYVAAIIDTNSETIESYDGDDEVREPVLLESIPNILEFDIEFPIECSFEPLFEDGMVQVDHYNSYKLGQLRYYDELTKDDSLIERKSGIDTMYESIAMHKDHDLNGSMTINPNGLIQL